jgi:GNAT superfamily N-acetyltransferase
MIIRALTGENLREWIHEIARLRITVFREYPYRYDGDEAYEREYLAGLTLDQNDMVIVAEEDERVVAAATSLPLLGPADITDHADRLFRAEGLDPSAFYYFSEILVLPEYRGRGLAQAFYQQREIFAAERGYTRLCFAVIITEGYPPDDYFDPSPFWRKMGFAPNPRLVFPYAWPTIQEDGTTKEQSHRMMFWIK